MALNAHELRKQLVEAILTQAIELDKRFHAWPLDVQRQYADKHERAVGEWLQKLKPHGIDATDIVDAVDKYEALERSWKEDEMLQRADIEARYYCFLVAEQKAEVEAFLERENLMGKAPAEYTSLQKAELRRIENRWAHLKVKGVTL